MQLRKSVLPVLLFLVASAGEPAMGAPHPPGRQAGQASQASTSRSAIATSRFHETPVWQIPAKSAVKDLLLAGGHLAWDEKNGKKWTVRLDGKRQGKAYDAVRYLSFSRGGAHLAFFGERYRQWYLVWDGQERPSTYTQVTPIAFQPHGSSWAFGGCAASKRCQLLVEGKATGSVYAQVSPPQYSRDGKRLAFFGKRGRKWVAVVDGKEMKKEVDAYSFWGFSPDSRHFFAAVRLEHGGWTYLVDGTPGPLFTIISPMAFSKDGKHYAYGAAWQNLAFRKNQMAGTIVLDGHPGPIFKGMGTAGTWLYLADVGLIAGAYYAGAPFTIIFFPGRLPPGQEVLPPGLMGVSDPEFDPKGNLVRAVCRRNGQVVMLDGNRAGPAFDDVVSSVVFSVHARHFAYVARRGQDFIAVTDNKTGEHLPANPNNGYYVVAIGWIVLSPRGTHLAFEVVRGGTEFARRTTTRAERTVVVSGPPQAELNSLGVPVTTNGETIRGYNALGISVVQFSKHARHFFYEVLGAQGDRDLVVVDDQESKLYGAATPPRLDPGGKALRFFAQDGAHIVRVNYPLPQ